MRNELLVKSGWFEYPIEILITDKEWERNFIKF